MLLAGYVGNLAEPKIKENSQARGPTAAVTMPMPIACLRNNISSSSHPSDGGWMKKWCEGWQIQTERNASFPCPAVMFGEFRPSSSYSGYGGGARRRGACRPLSTHAARHQ